MVALLPSPTLQFCDANGVPYAGGTIATFIPGTSTPAVTWDEPTGTTANTNPIVLDSAGRAIIYASGAVRMQLFDALGNLIWDQVSNTTVSAAMAPVMLAPTIVEAQALLGITAATLAGASNATAITAETTRAEAAEAAEIARAEAAEAVLTAAVAAETVRAETVEASLQAGFATAGNPVRGGAAAADATGHVRITFATPFPTACTSFVCTLSGGGFVSDTFNVTVDRLGADVWVTEAGSVVPKPDGFYWMAIGN